MEIIITGDFFIDDMYQKKLLFDKSVAELFHAADYRIVNLEAPITPKVDQNKILKTGPHLRMSEKKVIRYLKYLKVNMATLANNHILDYGAKGLIDTFESLKQNKIAFVGAGNSLNEAAQPLTLEKEGMRIAILNFCENEWSIAEDEKPGANPMDVIDNANQIKAAKATHDKVICIIHGGHEYYNLPSPRIQKQYRFYVDNGADAIVGHHSHCIGGVEIYNDVPIIYSLGNFIFTKENKNLMWYHGLIVTLNISKKNEIEFKLHPIKQDLKTYKTTISEGIEGEKTLAEVVILSEIIRNSEVLMKEWLTLIKQTEIQYLNSFSPIHFFQTKYITSAVKKLKIYKLFINKKHYKTMLNLIRCEAHRDILMKSMDRYLSA